MHQRVPHFVSTQALIFVALASVTLAAQSSPRRAVEELLAADRAYAAAARTSSVTDAISAMFADDVILSAAGAFHMGRDAATAQLRSMPDNAAGSRIRWAPVRGGISADGQHGFTYGFMTLTRADSTQTPLKYLTYWVRGANGWKAAVYRRSLRPAGTVSTAMREPLVPESLVAPSTDAAAISRYAREVGKAESDFSNLAGKIGLGPAFTRNAAPDAMNMGGPQSADFLYGPEAIGAGVGAGESGPSSLTWGADTVLAASSGDLGVTIGHIVAPGVNGAPARRIPFFTVWRKIGTGWKFVAE
jgi:ketosteroid isomerase-like protein